MPVPESAKSEEDVLTLAGKKPKALEILFAASC
jgi:hypothetical protein